jgi:hypothetical protein
MKKPTIEEISLVIFISGSKFLISFYKNSKTKQLIK